MLIYTPEQPGISTSYQKADKIHFRVEMEKLVLIYASVGFIVTHVKRRERNFLLLFPLFFAFHMDSSEIWLS